MKKLWPLSSTEILLYMNAMIVLLVGILLSYKNPEHFDKVFIVEDGPVEWMTFLALVTAGVVCFHRVYHLRHVRSKLFILCTFALGGLCFFGAGEEISWGQRIFNVYPPEFFIKHNAQYETNLHNLVVQGKKVNKIIFGTFLGIVLGLYLLILPVLYQKTNSIKQLVQRLAVPVPQVHQILFYVLLVFLVWLVNSPKKGELMELGGCLNFMMIVIWPFNQKIFLNKQL